VQAQAQRQAAAPPAIPPRNTQPRKAEGLQKQYSGERVGGRVRRKGGRQSEEEIGRGQKDSKSPWHKRNRSTPPVRQTRPLHAATFRQAAGAVAAGRQAV